MNDRPAGLEDAQLVVALEQAWGIEVSAATYLPVGFGSYHWRVDTLAGQPLFVTVDDLDRKQWLGSERDDVFRNLENAFSVATALRDEGGCEFVVAPIATREGAAVFRVHPRYGVAVFPYVDATPGEWGKSLDDAGRAQHLRHLAELHRATAVVGDRAATRSLDFAARGELEDALDSLHAHWDGGPYSETARAALIEHEGRVHEWLATFDELRGDVESSAPELVITHGEPHPGNVIRSDELLLLIDWDTVALAPRERDLWMFDDGSADCFEPYTSKTGASVDPTALALYPLTWKLTDIAFNVSFLRAPHGDTADARKTSKGLLDYLARRA